MTSAIYVLGAPGVGKSTLVRELLRESQISKEDHQIHGLLRGHEMKNGIYLGKAREQFPGTDGLPMNVSKDAMQWISDGFDHQLIVGEGARLGFSKFLTALGTATNLTLIYLDGTEATTSARCEARSSTQNMAWRRGAKTRARNAFDQTANAKKIVVDTTGLNPTHVYRLVFSQLDRDTKELLG